MTANRDRSLRDRIVDEIRYRIATGAWKPGSRLPPLRSLARELGAHSHTVRGACLELGRAGALVLRHGSGIYVARDAPDPDRTELIRIVGVALRRAVGLGFSARDFLQAAWAKARGGARVAVFAECSVEQARQHAREVAAAVGAPVRPALVHRLTAGHRGARIVTTYFHAHELRRRFPGAEILPVTVRPDPTVLSHLSGALRRSDVALLCRDAPSVKTFVAPLRAAIPRSVRLHGYSLADLADLRRDIGRFRAVIYTPPCRRQARALARRGMKTLELVYRIEPHSLARLSARFHRFVWTSAARKRPQGRFGAGIPMGRPCTGP